jgi:hypothetical protein
MRGGVSFIGIGVEYATFKADSSLSAVNEGAAVTLVSNDTVGLGTADKPLVGKILKYEDDGIVSVQYEGFAEFDADSTALPVVGGVAVVNGAGKVKAAPATTTIDMATNVVVSVDSVNNKAVILLK